MVDEDIEALFKSVDSYSSRLEKEEKQSEVLTQEAGDLRTYLENLWNELMETKEHLLNQESPPIEEIQTSRVNNDSKSGCNLTIPEAFERSSWTEANYNSQDFSLEAKALIDQLPHVEICCSSEADSRELLFSDEEVLEAEQKSRTSSVYSWYDSDCSSTLEDLIEEELRQSEELESGQTERSLEPSLEALLTAYDIESIVDEFNGKEEQEEEIKVKKDVSILNSAMSIYNNELDETRLKSKLQESSTKEEDPDPAQNCDGMSNKKTQELEIGDCNKKDNLSCLETASFGSAKKQKVKWTEHSSEVFEEEKTMDDGDLVEVYKQETKESAAVKKKRLWFFFKEKRLWPKCPKRSKTWFLKLCQKFRIFKSKSLKHK